MILSLFFKRKEAFRYTFDKSLTVELKLLSKQDECGEDFSFQVGYLENLSPSGLCFHSELTYSLYSTLQFDFDLGMERITIIGKVIWIKDYGMKKVYGVLCENDQVTKGKVIQGLKEFVSLKK